jgi:hypothetical protein
MKSVKSVIFYLPDPRRASKQARTRAGKEMEKSLTALTPPANGTPRPTCADDRTPRRADADVG